MTPITLSSWTSAADPLAAVFADGGPLAAAAGPHYAYSRLQHDYARHVRTHCVACLKAPGRVVILEAEPGVGKTMGYAVPAFIHGALTGGRVLVSTYTNQLKRQTGAHDAPAAALAAAAATGLRRPSIAVRHSYLEFASPVRARNFAGAIEAEAGGATPASRALRELADWTETELQAADGADWRTMTLAGRGLVGTWEELNPASAVDLPRDAADSWAIDGSDEEERALKAMYDNAVDEADIILTSHASTILDARFGGAIFGGRERPFAVAVIDEADRMPDAARTVLSAKLSLRSVERTALTVAAAVEASREAIGPARLGALRQTLAHHRDTFGRLTVAADELAKGNAKRPRHRRTHAAVLGNEEWLATLEAAADGCVEIAEQLTAVAESGVTALKPMVDILLARIDGIENFIEAARNPTKADGRTFVSFSPVNSEPSILIDAKYAGRLLHRLWDGTKRNGYRPFAESVILTSATAAQPGARGPSRWDPLAQAIGLGITGYEKFDRDNSREFFPDKFADIDFVVAHPSAPAPSLRDDAAIEYQAKMIAEAAGTFRNGRANVLALTTSFADADRLADALVRRGLGDRLIRRGSGVSLRRAVHDFKVRKNPILITPGAWEGIDLPGLIDHLVICRLPWSPPEDTMGRPMEDRGEEGIKVSENHGRMMARLKQGIGRATRRADDKATVWIADPRFPPPAAVEERLLQVSPYARNRIFHECIPVRFRAAMAAARVLPPDPAPAPRRARLEKEGEPV